MAVSKKYILIHLLRLILEPSPSNRKTNTTLALLLFVSENKTTNRQSRVQSDRRAS